MKMFHQVFAYLMILSGNLAVGFGIYHNRTYLGDDYPLEWLNFGVSISVLIISEILY
jgi:hypothetical protein